MKAGDAVRFKGSTWEKLNGRKSRGILIRRWGKDNPDWWEILLDGEIVQWPESQLVLEQSLSYEEK